MKIVIIGGHLSPALSVVKALPTDAKILFIGRKYTFEGDNSLSLEYKTIISLNIPFCVLNTGRLQRKLSKHTLTSLFKLPLGFAKSFLTLVKFRPDVVVGFGGYVSIPVVISASLLGIPIVLHEQTLEAGLANRFLCRFAAMVCVSWENSQKYFPKNKTVFTGNPIRQMSDGKWHMANDEKLPVIYITGGSSGSHFINILVEGCIQELLKAYIVVHQTGDATEFHDFARLEKLRSNLESKLSKRYFVKKFIDPSEIGSLLKIASLVISRSGMNTITELLHFEKPCLLIPLPFSQNNEQLKNAKYLEKLGLGKVLQQNLLSPKELSLEIDHMFHNINNYKIKKNEFNEKINKNAVQNIVSVINYVYKTKTGKKS